jgi:hypothetical protein
VLSSYGGNRFLGSKNLEKKLFLVCLKNKKNALKSGKYLKKKVHITSGLGLTKFQVLDFCCTECTRRNTEKNKKKFFNVVSES